MVCGKVGFGQVSGGHARPLKNTVDIEFQHPRDELVRGGADTRDSSSQKEGEALLSLPSSSSLERLKKVALELLSPQERERERERERAF